MVARNALLLLAWIVVSTAWLVVHAVLLIRTARAPGLGPVARVLAWLPPLTPVVSWRAGARAGAVFWVVSAALYLVLRSVE